MFALLSVGAQRAVQLDVGAEDRPAPAADAGFVGAPLVVERLGRDAIMEVFRDLLAALRSPHLITLGTFQEAPRDAEGGRTRRTGLGCSPYCVPQSPSTVRRRRAGPQHVDGPLEALVLLDHVRPQDVVDVDALHHDDAVDGGLQGPLLAVHTDWVPQGVGVRVEIPRAAVGARLRLAGRARLAPDFGTE
jgi:hypothetical protein